MYESMLYIVISKLLIKENALRCNTVKQNAALCNNYTQFFKDRIMIVKLIKLIKQDSAVNNFIAFMLTFIVVYISFSEVFRVQKYNQKGYQNTRLITSSSSQKEEVLGKRKITSDVNNMS